MEDEDGTVKPPSSSAAVEREAETEEEESPLVASEETVSTEAKISTEEVEESSDPLRERAESSEHIAFSEIPDGTVIHIPVSDDALVSDSQIIATAPRSPSGRERTYWERFSSVVSQSTALIPSVASFSASSLLSSASLVKSPAEGPSDPEHTSEERVALMDSSTAAADDAGASLTASEQVSPVSEASSAKVEEKSEKQEDKSDEMKEEKEEEEPLPQSEEILVIPSVQWHIIRDDKRKCLVRNGILQCLTLPRRVNDEREDGVVMYIRTQAELRNQQASDESATVSGAEDVSEDADGKGGGSGIDKVIEKTEEEKEEGKIEERKPIDASAEDGGSSERENAELDETTTSTELMIVKESKKKKEDEESTSPEGTLYVGKGGITGTLSKVGDTTMGIVKSALFVSTLEGRTYELKSERLCIKVFDRNYVFTSDNEFFGLVLDPHCDSSLVSALEATISSHCQMKAVSSGLYRPISSYPIDKSLFVGPSDPWAQAGERLAAMIREGTVQFIRGIRFGTEKTAGAIAQSGYVLKEKYVHPLAEPIEVPASVKSKMAQARLAGIGASKLTGALRTGAIAAKDAIASEISATISEKSAAAEESRSEVIGPKARAAKRVAQSVMSGAVAVIDEATKAAIHVVGVSGRTVADVAGHRYGKDVKYTAETASDFLVAASKATANWNQLGFKTIAKRVAADVLESDSDEEGDGFATTGTTKAIEPAGESVASSSAADGSESGKTVGLESKKALSDAVSKVSGGLTLDPVTSLQALTVVHTLDEIGMKHGMAKKERRRQKVGIEPHQYKTHEDYLKIMQETEKNGESGESGSAMSVSADAGSDWSAFRDWTMAPAVKTEDTGQSGSDETSADAASASAAVVSDPPSESEKPGDGLDLEVD